MRLFKIAFPYNSYGKTSALLVYAKDEKHAKSFDDVRYCIEDCDGGFFVITEVPMEPGVVASEIETNV